MKCRTGVIQERRDSGNKGCMKEGIQELRDAKFGFEKLRSGTIFLLQLPIRHLFRATAIALFISILVSSHHRDMRHLF